MAVIKNMMVRAGADFSAFTTQSKKAAKSMRGMQSSISRSCAGIKTSVSGVKKILSGLGVAVSLAAIVSAGKRAAEAYDAQAEAEMKLATVMRNTMRARNSEIQSVLDLCSAQQRLGVIGDEVQLAGAQELATYLTQTRTLKKLIPVMNDMAAQQYGWNVTAENTVTIATMLGKVMNGQTSALSRLGYTFTEAQESILKYGTEEERAATLARVISQSVGGMNRALANTPTGRMRQLSNTLGDIREKFGECVRLIGVLLLPLLWRIADVLEKITNFASRAAVSMNKVLGTAAALTGWQSVSAGVSTATDAIEDMGDELGSAQKAAEAVKRSVAGFDELNILGSPKDESSTTLTTPASAIEPGFGLGEEMEEPEGTGWLGKLMQRVKDNAQLIKDTVLAVGAGFLTWKIARALDLGLQKTLGLALSVAGAVELGLSAFRAWNNGVDFSNLQGMLGGTAALVTGLDLAFGKTGAAIGLLIGGGAMLVTSMKEWITTGNLTTESFFGMEGGMIAVGAGIALLTGSWIPLAIAGIAGLGLAIYEFWGEITTWCSDAYTAISEWWESTAVPGIASAIDWILQGFTDLGSTLSILWQETLRVGSEIFTGLGLAVSKCIEGISATLKNHQALVNSVFEAIKTAVSSKTEFATSTMGRLITSAVSVTQASFNMLSNITQATFSFVGNTIVTTIQACTALLAGTSWYGLGVQLMQGFLNGLRSLMSTIWNEVMDFVRRCVEAVRSALGCHSPSKVFEEIGLNVDEGALKGLRSGIPELLAEGEGMAEGLVKAVSPAALDAGAAWEGAGARFQNTGGEGSLGGGERLDGILALLGEIYSAVLDGHEIAVQIGEDELLHATVRANNRAIRRTGMSPIRI